MDTKIILIIVFAWAFISTLIGLYIIFKKLNKLFPLNIKKELENINEKPIQVFEGMCWRLLIKIYMYETFLLISTGNKAVRISYNEITKLQKGCFGIYYTLEYNNQRYNLFISKEDFEYIKQKTGA